MKTPYTKLTTSGFSAIQATTVANLYPYQLKQISELLDQVNWGRANSNSGQGSQSDISNQPTLGNILTLLGANNP
jgi:hypothetical protein